MKLNKGPEEQNNIVLDLPVGPFHLFVVLQWIPESWNMALGGLVLGSPIPYLKGMRILMFQLSGFCFKVRGLVATIGLWVYPDMHNLPGS